MGLHGQRHPSRRPPRPTSHTSVPARYSAVLRPLVKYPRFVMRGMRVGPIIDIYIYIYIYMYNIYILYKYITYLALKTVIVLSW